jgi:hypothetical protein
VGIGMSKLDRDLKAVMEDAFSNGERLLKEMLPVIVDEDMDEDEKMQHLIKTLEKSKPKTYEDYIHDIKRAFIEDGWARKES